MPLYRITAQAEVGTKRIARIIAARDEQDALHMVAAQLQNAGYYPVSIVRAA